MMSGVNLAFSVSEYMVQEIFRHVKNQIETYSLKMLHVFIAEVR